MKIQRSIFTVIAILSMLLSNFSNVSAAPGLPSSFHGTVKVDGVNVDVGTPVTAWVNGVQYASYNAILASGNTVYTFSVPNDDSDTTAIEGGTEGETVVFKIGDLTADQQGIWHGGTSVTLNLTVSTITCYALSISHSGNGTSPAASPANSTGCVSGSYVSGESISLSGATSDTGWHVASWSGTSNDSSTDTTNSLIMPAATKAVSVSYAKDSVTLGVSIVGNGNVTQNPLPPYLYGDIISLTPAALAGWQFSGWSGDLGGSANPETITLNGNKSVTATFTATPTYTLTTSVLPASSGSVTLNPDTGPYASGTVVTVTAVPIAGYTFSSWSGNLTGSTNPTTITMDGNKSVTANFTAIPTYTLTTAVLPASSGSVTLNPSTGPYTSGTVVTVTAVPAAGYTFSSWSGNLTGSTNPTTITMDGNKSVTANFTALPTYTLTTSVLPASSGSVTLNPATGPYVSGTVVTVTAVPASGYIFSSWSGNLTGSTNPTTITMDGNKSVTANFTANECTTINLTATEDTYLSAANVQYNNGGRTELHVNGTTDTNRRTALLKWDLSSIPTTVTVSSASLSLNVTDASPLVFNLYNMRRTWVEGTSDQANSSTSANWNTYNGSTSWGTVGAANTSSDRYDTNLWGAGTTSFSSTGSKTLDLNTDGKSVIQGWINASISNYGLIIQNYSGSTNNAVYFTSSEGTTAANRPKLNITYCNAPAGPAITTTGTLTAFTSQPGVVSAEKSYTVSGSNLTNNLVITAPSDFEISTTSGSGFGSTVNLTPTIGTVGTTTIYVHFNRATAGTSTGNITHTSTGATTQNIAVSGNASDMGAWTAYNDCGFISGQISTNITTYECFTNAESGLLIDYATGSDTPVTVTVATSGTVESQITSDYIGAETDAGTDAYTTFHDFVNMVGGMRLGTADSYIDLTFTGLDPAKTYAFATTANRANSEYTTRDTVFTISDVDSATNASTSGVVVNSNLSVTFTTGYNTVNGYVARWTGIAPGSDGDFKVRLSVSTDTYAYGPAVFVLGEEAIAGPKINTTGTLSAFSSPPGVVSAEQSYTISGSDLSGNIVITAPADFEVSTSEDTGFGSTLSLSPSGGTVAATTIYVHFLRATVGSSSGNITNTSTGATTRNVAVSGTASNANHAPNQPVLVEPLDNATGVSIPPTLEVTVSDPDVTDNLDVSFYGRAAGSTSAGDDFTLIAIPDTQNEAQYYSSVMYSQFQWIADHKSSNNIVFATNLGDIVNTASDSAQWTVADTAYDYLDSGNVAYSVGPGNHDLGGSYETYFGVSRFTGKSWYGGHYGSDNLNNYSLFSASGNDFILLNLQYTSTTAQRDWADALLKANPLRRGIVVEHDILNTDNSWNNQALFTALKDNPNLFLMLCGHMHTASDGSAYRSEIGDDGHTIHILQTDYQDYTNGGNGYLRVLRFSPADDKIYATIYSPYTSAYLSNTSNYEQMEMVYDLAGGGASAYTLIGTDNDVVNGENASITWSGRANDTEYEWYTTVSDGTDLITGSTWSFTTGNGTTNQAPVITESDPQAVTMSEDGSPTAFSKTLNATDVDSATLTWSISSAATHGTATASGTGASKVIGYTPTANYNGSDSFVVQVSDGSLTDTITVNVTIGAVNDAPVITESDPQAVTMSEDGSPTAFSKTLNATDVDSATLTWSISSAATHGTATASGTGASKAIGYTSTANYNGSDSFVVQVSDGSLTDTITVNVTIGAVNDAPVITEGTSVPVSMSENGTPTAFALTLNTTDVDSATLTWSISSAATHGTVTATGTGLSKAIGYTPTTNYNGSDSFVVQVSDGSLTDTITVNVTIGGVNNAPVITETDPQSVSMSEDGSPNPFDLTLHATDADAGDTLTWSIFTAASHGTATASGTGTSKVIGYTPTANYFGTDSFVVQVSDGTATDTITVNVNIFSVFDTPVITGQVPLSTNMDTELTIYVTDITILDPDNIYPTDFYLMVLDGTNYTHVGATITPALGFTGALTVPVAVNDGNSTSDPYNLTVTVNSVNTFTLSVSKTGTGTGTVASSPPGIDCGADCSQAYSDGTIVTLTATPTAGGYNRFIGWSGAGCSGIGTCFATVDAAKTVTAEFQKTTFSDVPFSHPNWAYIEALWDNGFTSGCQAAGEPLKFCPEQTMLRAESAVFMLRGKLGAIGTPTDAEPYVFGDDWTSIEWAIPWAEKMWDEGMTAGCQYPAGADPKLFCPYTLFTRDMGAVFALRIKHGSDMPVPVGTGQVFADMTDLVSSDGIGVGWAEQAYAEGLIPNCGIDPISSKPNFCPFDQLDRSWSAYMIVKAKGMTIPE